VVKRGLADTGREASAAASMPLAAAPRSTRAPTDRAAVTGWGVVGTQLELHLATSEQAPEIARRRVVERFAAQLGPAQLEDARLLTSELVTNAVVHGRGAIGLSALLDEDRLMIEVTDEGDGFDPTVRLHGLDAVGGNGLNIVDTLASRWGIHAGSSHVWFELERPGPRLGTDAKAES
jgi:anti-sigma regulatory factor (Ser/Thr protein kinase)